MSSFADNMKAFTDHLKSSIHEREDALARLHEATGDLLTGAREFMEQVAGDRQAMAEDLRAGMNAFRDDLDRKVNEMRHEHQEAHRQRSADLNRMLDDTNKARHDAVHGLKATFHESQRALADDLRKAGAAWREFAATR